MIAHFQTLCGSEFYQLENESRQLENGDLILIVTYIISGVVKLFIAKKQPFHLFVFHCSNSILQERDLPIYKAGYHLLLLGFIYAENPLLI